MKSTTIAAVAATFAFATLSSPSNATIYGYFDAIQVGISDTAIGWICDGSNVSNTPNEVSLVAYIDGVYYNEWSLSSGVWGISRPDTSGFCTGNTNVGFNLPGFFAGNPATTTRLYYKDLSTGVLTEMGGSPKVCTTANGPGTCY